MKVFMQNKKKQVVYLVLIAVSLGATAWIWLGMNKSATQPVPSADTSMALDAPGISTEDLSTSIFTENLLPYGSDFDTELFSDPRFLELNLPAQLQVDPEELGRENPFNPVDAESPESPENPESLEE